MNLTVKDLRAILDGLDDNIKIVIAEVDNDNADNTLDGFRYVRTAGILVNKYEDTPALCLASTINGIDINTLLKENHRIDTICEKVMF